METEKVYTDLSPAQREAQARPAFFTRLQTFYPKQDKNMTAQFVFGAMVEIATPILEAYHSDLFHDVENLQGRDWKYAQVFYYCVGKCGTNIMDKTWEAYSLQRHGREHIYMFNYAKHPTMKGCFLLSVSLLSNKPAD